MTHCPADSRAYVFQNLRRMEGDAKEPGKDLDELQNSDWVRRTFVHTFKMSSVTALNIYNNADQKCPPQARFWVQVMRDLRDGVKLKKVQERQYNPLPIEYQLTPYEMLMDDIRSKRYKLRKVMVNDRKLTR